MVKRAILIGITRYPDNPLDGCLNDVMLMYKILKDIYGFTEFAVLDNNKASKKNWMTTLLNMAKRSNPGDWLAIWYSGHGTQLVCSPSTCAFEIDKMDECPVTWDMDWDNPMRDDDLNGIIMSMDTGVKLVVGMDCCFSGTMLKNVPPMKNGHPIKNKYLPPPLHLVLESGDIDLDDELRIDSSKHKDKGLLERKTFIHNPTTQGNAILVSACSDKQTSADCYFGKRYHGAMTFYLAQTLKEHDWNISYRNLIEIINEKLEKEEFEQNPQLECIKELEDKLFLGGTKK